MENKRNVSLTCPACKLFESILTKTILVNAMSQNLLCKEQFAYRPGYSCALQLLTCQNDFAKMLNNSDAFDIVLFDFKSAFELTTHKKLLDCLPSLGVGNRIVSWIRSFLHNRTFRVSVNGVLSSEASITSGCPQGTILGCLAFCLYTNSLQFVFSDKISYKVYADDIKVYAKVNDENDYNELQKGINDFYDWTKSLDLNLSLEKCNVMHCGIKNMKKSYVVNSVEIKSAEIVRDLGILMTPDFRFTEQTREVVNKAMKRLNYIMRSFVLTDVKIYERIFDIYVLPIVTYCSPVWNPFLMSDKQLLQSIFNRFRRKVAYKCKIDKTMIVKKSLGDIFEKNDATMFRSITAKPEICDQIFDTVETATRSGRNYRPKFVAKTEKVNRLFAWRVSKCL